MGFIFALAYVSLEFRNTGKVSGIIRYCGELAIMTGLLAIAGAVLSGMTINLLLVLPDLYLAGFRGKPLDRMERIINRYPPVYFIYSSVVIFIFPLIF